MRDALDEDLAAASEQGSNNWFDVRIGRFTSSEMHRLMKSGKRLMTDEELKSRPKKGPGSKSIWIEDESVVSDDAETYIYEKVAEVLTGQTISNGFSNATAWGEDLEPVAAEYFLNKTGYSSEVVAFVPFGDHAGGSPDRFVNGDEGLEIKCPYNPKNHIINLMLTDQYDLKRMHPEYYWQCMSNLRFTGKKLWNFVSYDYRFTKEEHKMAWIKIYPKPDEFQVIDLKLAMAIKKKLELLITLK